MKLSDPQIKSLFDNTNFGPGLTANGRRGLMVECVLKRLCGFGEGSTIIGICKDASLLTPLGNPSEAGRRWAFRQIYKSDETIVERLAK